MNPEALVFLCDDLAAQKLAVAWPLVPRSYLKRRDGTIGAATIARWADLSGVNENVTRRIGAVLRAHGICRDDGTTEKLALDFISSQAMAAIPRARPAPKE
jgi:hypothetical protein